MDVIEFIDEMAVEANANTARLWSFGKPIKRAKAKVSRFYSINGESVVEFYEGIGLKTSYLFSGR